MRIIAIVYFLSTINGQARIGEWRAHTSPLDARQIIHHGKNVIAATGGGLLVLDEQNYFTLTTIEGLEGVNLKAIEYVGSNVKICNSPKELESIDKIILPGVGAFEDCIKKLKNTGFIDALNELVLHKGIPVYGICLGMQVMAKKSYEFGEHRGLNFIEGEIDICEQTRSSLQNQYFEKYDFILIITFRNGHGLKLDLAQLPNSRN